MTAVTVTTEARTVVVTEGDGETTVVTVPGSAVLIETIGLGPQGPGGVIALYGNFIDTSDQPLVSTSAAQPLTLNTTLENRGITVTNGSRINFELAGTYKILASLQITNSSNNISEVNVFFKQNGTTIANSNTRIDLEPRKSVNTPYHGCFTIEFQLSATNGDYVEIYWSAGNLGIAVDTIPQDALHPQAPSAIINVAQVMFASPGETYVYNQATPSSNWTITHNLGFRPSVEICDSGSQEVEADVTHLSTNVAVILFTVPVAGFARLT